MCLLVRGHPLRGVPLAVFLLLFRVNSLGSNAVTVAVLGEHSRRSDGAAAGSSPGTIGLLEGLESDDSKNLANVGTMTDLVEGMEGVRSAFGVRRDYGGGMTAHATAGENVGIIGSSHDVVTRFSSLNSIP